MKRQQLAEFPRFIAAQHDMCRDVLSVDLVDELSAPPTNRLREEFGFVGTPIHLTVKPREKRKRR